MTLVRDRLIAASRFKGALARKTSNQENITDAMNTKVTWDSTDYDTDSLFSDANDRLTVDEAGYWRITCGFRFSGAVGFSDGRLVLRRNGSEVQWLGRNNESAQGGFLGGAVTLLCSASDYFEVWCYFDTTGDVTDITGGADEAYFQVEFLGI